MIILSPFDSCDYFPVSDDNFLQKKKCKSFSRWIRFVFVVTLYRWLLSKKKVFYLEILSKSIHTYTQKSRRRVFTLQFFSLIELKFLKIFSIYWYFVCLFFSLYRLDSWIKKEKISTNKSKLTCQFALYYCFYVRGNGKLSMLMHSSNYHQQTKLHRHHHHHNHNHPQELTILTTTTTTTLNSSISHFVQRINASAANQQSTINSKTRYQNDFDCRHSIFYRILFNSGPCFPVHYARIHRCYLGKTISFW